MAAGLKAWRAGWRSEWKCFVSMWEGRSSVGWSLDILERCQVELLDNCIIISGSLCVSSFISLDGSKVAIQWPHCTLLWQSLCSLALLAAVWINHSFICVSYLLLEIDRYIGLPILFPIFKHFTIIGYIIIIIIYLFIFYAIFVLPGPWWFPHPEVESNELHLLALL